MADQRYQFIGGVIRAAVKRPALALETRSDKADRIITHPIWGVPIFLLLMWVVFQFTANVSAPFLDWRPGLVMSFPQHARHELRNGNERIHLPQQEVTAHHRGRALGQVACQHDPGLGPGQAGGEDGWPDVTPMVPVHELRPLAPDELGGGQNEAQFRRPFRRRGVQRNAELLRHAREVAPPGTDHPDADTPVPQLGAELDTLVIGAAAGEEGVEVENRQGFQDGFFRAGVLELQHALP